MVKTLKALFAKCMPMFNLMFFHIKKPAEALRDPHKTALINQHHTSVGSGEVVKNGAQHRSP